MQRELNSLAPVDWDLIFNILNISCEFTLRRVPQNLADDLVDIGSHGGLVLWTSVDPSYVTPYGTTRHSELMFNTFCYSNIVCLITFILL